MTQTQMYEAHGTLVNTCCCGWCPACEMAFCDVDYDFKCPECDGEAEDFNCQGDLCWNYMTEDMAQYLAYWKDATGSDDFAIYGRGMGWTNSSGHTGRLWDFKGLLNAMRIDTSWCITWKLSEDHKEFTMVRTSHDELGASFELRPWHEGDDE